MRNHWYEKAEERIREALIQVPPGAPKWVIARAVLGTIPPPSDGVYAYQQWHQARKDVLAERFPDLFPKHKKETDGRLF